MEETSTEKRNKDDKTYTLCTMTTGKLKQKKTQKWKLHLLCIILGWIKKSLISCDKNQKIIFNVKL